MTRRKIRHRSANKHGTPKLVPLPYGNPYCELCKTKLSPGTPVGWWRVASGHSTRPAVYCADCHHANVRARRPLQ